MHVHRSGRRAFTLVELLVVIGIIAALIGILLPVLGGVQARGRDIKCQSNLRQIAQSIIGYASEHKGVMPYGFYFNRSINHYHSQGNPDPYNSANTWDEASDNPGSSGDPENTQPFISWASLVGKYLIKRTNADNDNYSFSPVLICPEAEQSAPHPVSYVINMVVGVAPYYERQLGVAPRYALKPPQQTLMLKEGTALVWDTNVQPDWENNVGYLMGADIDGQRMWNGAAVPQWRYWTQKDPFGRIPPGNFGYNRAVVLTAPGQVLGPAYKNIDPPPLDTAYGYQGNLRFRHNKNTACNVAFSDGSVRQFTAKMNGDKTVRSHDALRKFFMIKWPPGIPVDPTQPN